MDISRAKEVLDYWFSKGLYTADFDKWFMKSQDYDEEIKEKFGDLLKEAEQGKGFSWLHTKDSYVAHIILLDQFSRHIYRGSGDSFKNDNGCMLFVELGWNMYNKQLKGYEFMFAFMPYMHTENMTYQRNGQRYFEMHKNENEREVRKFLASYSLADKTATDHLKKSQLETKMYESMQPHVTGHANTMRNFGRFPKRNLALGRKSTLEEIRYMEQPEVKKRPY